MKKYFLKKEKKRLCFLKVDEDGKDIFYPWGSPGESFYVRDEKKCELILVLYVSGLSIIVGFIGLNILINSSLYQHFFLATLIHIIAWEIVPIAYFFFMKNFSKDLVPYIESGSKNPFITKALSLLLGIQICSAFIFLYLAQANDSLLPMIMMLINILYSMALMLLIRLSLKKNGRFLHKEKFL